MHISKGDNNIVVRIGNTRKQTELTLRKGEWWAFHKGKIGYKKTKLKQIPPNK